MINPITRWLIIGLILVSTAAVGILYIQKQGLEGDNHLLKEQLGTANTKVKSQLSIISELEQNQKDNEKAHSELLGKIAVTKNLLTKHEQTIRNLEQQNEQLKIWSNTRLPNPVIILRRRPAISGSQAYQDWLYERDAMSAAANQPANEWRPAP
jgi:LysB family phage lysis regulatory protein